MLIDKIISAKTDQSVSDFTGGNIQYSVSKYTKQMKIKLVLYFGFDFNRNTMSRQIEIQKKDVHTLVDELSIKTESYLLSLVDDDILDLDSFVKDSYECSTTIVRGTCIDRDKEDKEDSDKEDSSNSTIANATDNNDFFEIVWINYTINFINKLSGRNDRNKSAAKKNFNSIMKCTFDGVPRYEMQDFIEEYVKSEMTLKDVRFCRSLKTLMQRDNIQDYLDKIQG